MTTTFSQRVTELALAIPAGRVTTYGILAAAAGGGGQAARSVSAVLGKFPNQGMIPWHRIVYAGGKAWLSTDKELELKRRAQFAAEGIELNDKGKILDFEEVVYRFD